MRALAACAKNIFLTVTVSIYLNGEVKTELDVIATIDISHMYTDKWRYIASLPRTRARAQT